MDLTRAILEAEEKAESATPAKAARPLRGRVMRFREDADVVGFDKPPTSLTEIEGAERDTHVQKGTEIEILEVFTADVVLTSLPSGHSESHCALVEWSALEEV